MKRMALVLTVALCAGCGAHTKVHLNANSSSSGSGSSTSSSVQVHADSGSRWVTLLGLTVIAASIVQMERAHLGSLWRRDDPPLAPDRVITEHDCRFPIESITGNLRCK